MNLRIGTGLCRVSRRSSLISTTPETRGHNAAFVTAFRPTYDDPWIRIPALGRGFATQKYRGGGRVRAVLKLPAVTLLHPSKVASWDARRDVKELLGWRVKHTSTQERYIPKDSDAYTHQPLVHDDEIRLVRLLAGPRGERVRCQLEHVRLNDPKCPEYTALSYVWGRGGERPKMQCHADGASIRVTQNCYEALSQMRDEHRDRLVWVDAMSIDQSNIGERNHQVLLMRTVYGNAASVTIFLGHGSPAVAELLRRIDASDESIFAAWTLDETNLVKDFLRHPYWRRMWVLQEIYAAKSVSIMYYGETFQEDLLRKIISIRMTVLDTPLWFSLPLTVLIRDSTGYLDLWTLLTFTRTFNSSDARDKVIALLGLVEYVPDTVKEVLADYKASDTKVMQRVVMHLYLQVVRMYLRDGDLDTASWRQLLDWSRADDEAPTDGTQRKHVLRVSPATDKTRSSQSLRVVAVSESHSKQQFTHLWRRCHDFLDINLPFNRVITFAGALRSAAETRRVATGDADAFDEEEEYSPRFSLAITADGRLHAVPRDLQVGDVLKDIGTAVAFETSLPAPEVNLDDVVLDRESRQIGKMLWSSNIVDMH